MRVLVFLIAVGMAAPALAQQTGSIIGNVTDPSGAVLPGVTVVATSPVLPGPRETVTDGNGHYQLPALQPGTYTVTFTLAGMQTVTRTALVLLQQETVADAQLGLQAVSESVTVTAATSLIERDSAALKSGLSNDQIVTLPVGQEYRDLVKLIPGVQFTQDSTRGPSAGGSGQDNVYQFDGVNVTLPLFGTLSAEPASYDVAQVTTVKGGARAMDFNRSGGFAINTISKSGTSRYSGQVSFQFQTKNTVAEVTEKSASRFDQTKSWTTLNLGGPVVQDKLFFYGSYYRPTISRDNRANAYGELPDFDSTRNEGFGKITFTPLNSVLVNVSYRDSHRLDKSDLFGQAAAPTTGTGNESRQKIGTAEGSWVIDNRSFLDFKYTHFTLKTQGRPDNVANTQISTTPGTSLDVNNLDTLGLLVVPKPLDNNPAANAFIDPLIQRYGFACTPELITAELCSVNGAITGGGTVGFGTTFDADDFFRDSGQIGYNLTLGTNVRHNLHVGYQYYVDSEDLTRSSNGWGLLTVPAGDISFEGTPVFYQAAFQQQTTGLVPTIHSEYRSHNIEVNDTINWQNWTFNVGLLASKDILYGQGLREDSSTLSGYSLSPGTKYKMYEVPFGKMLQPRVSATWAYNGRDTVYASYATYNPAASSLPRAASWDRNIATTINAYFDASGVLFATDPVESSSGKLFVPDMTPRTIREYMIGTARQFNPHWTARLYGRYRHGDHFWEDTNNTARVRFDPPPGIPREEYIPTLDEQLDQIGSGSSYVIAELDGAFTKYYEATVETEYQSNKAFVRGSYTWSHYYGNFDQDNTTTGNDANIFIGSSFIADGAGRQLWNFRYGDLRGDRRHMLKVYGSYLLDWHGTVGAYFVAQSGQPWEVWSYEPYKALTGSTSDTSRFAEPAGSHRTSGHTQLDLKYIQDIRATDRLRFQIVGDLYNVFNSQTGYNINPKKHDADFEQPRSFFAPRIFQLSFRLQF